MRSIGKRDWNQLIITSLLLLGLILSAGVYVKHIWYVNRFAGGRTIPTLSLPFDQVATGPVVLRYLPEPEVERIDIDLAKAKVSWERNPENRTVTKKFDFEPINKYGYQVYLVGAEFEGKFYLLCNTKLAVQNLEFDTVFNPTKMPESLELSVNGASGKNYLFALPISAEDDQVTLFYKLP